MFPAYIELFPILDPASSFLRCSFTVFPFNGSPLPFFLNSEWKKRSLRWNVCQTPPSDPFQCWTSISLHFCPYFSHSFFVHKRQRERVLEKEVLLLLCSHCSHRMALKQRTGGWRGGGGLTVLSRQSNNIPEQRGRLRDMGQTRTFTSHSRFLR